MKEPFRQSKVFGPHLPRYYPVKSWQPLYSRYLSIPYTTSMRLITIHHVEAFLPLCQNICLKPRHHHSPHPHASNGTGLTNIGYWSVMGPFNLCEQPQSMVRSDRSWISRALPGTCGCKTSLIRGQKKHATAITA